MRKKELISGIKANAWLYRAMGFDRQDCILNQNDYLYRKLISELQAESELSKGNGRGKYYYYSPRVVENFIYRSIVKFSRVAPIFTWYDTSQPLKEQIQKYRCK